MLNLNKVRKQFGIRSVAQRKPLSDIIGESYELMYECKKPNLRKLIESHIEDINQNPTQLTALNDNLFTLKSLVENEGLDDTRIEVETATEVNLDPEMKEITDLKDEEPEEAETETREEKTEKAIEVSDSPLSEQFKRFAENSKSKLFVKNLGKSLGKMTESKKSFNLQESIDLYKASNSMMTQMAIELEHNEAFRSTFNSCTRVLGEAVKNVLDSIREGKAIDEHATTVLKRFSSALREDSDEDIDNFIDWVEDEDSTSAEAEEASEEVEGEVEGCPHEAAEELLADVAPEDVPTAVEDIIDATVESDETDDTPLSDEDLSEEEEEDLKKYLALIRGVEEDSEEMEAEPTEEEVTAMESRLRYKREAKKCKDCKKTDECDDKKKMNEGALSEFSKNDWYAYAGADNFEDGSSPLIYDDEDATVIVSGDPDGGAVVEVDLHTADVEESYMQNFGSKKEAVDTAENIISDMVNGTISVGVFDSWRKAF